ncbi:MAG: HAMP domain-containing protein [Deltaproteobacteria bacterium]|nr:HAMP domain-containing protein [Deltaproteobacteria bacterium]
MMTETPKLDVEQKRRRREFIIIAVVVPAILLITYIESHISLVSGDIPIATNIFLLGLININIILLILVIFLVIRNTVKLYIERKKKVMGSKLMTKLVTAFVALTIIPTFLLFFVVIGFINKSIDGWFGIRIEDSLKESLDLAQNYYKDMTDKVSSGARATALAAAREGFFKDAEGMRKYVDHKIEDNDFSTIEVFASDGKRIYYAISSKVNKNMVPDIDPQAVLAVIQSGEASGFTESVGVGDVVRAISPVPSLNLKDKSGGAVVVGYYVPRSLLDKMKEITTAFEGYKQLKLLKNPVKASYFTILLIITLLIVFFSIWIGRYIAKEITVPIHELAEGTHAVASGNLDYRIAIESNDEIGLLVKSFNRMTEDLTAGKSKLETANLDLRRTNIELEQRRRYIEIVLGNVSAGVVSIDKTGRIISINRVAAEMLGAEEGYALGKNYKDALRESEVLREMIREMMDLGLPAMERQMRVAVRDKAMTVLVNLNALRDESGDYLGMVAVLDDLTHLLKTQRMFAWKEVAKRIAHEIKNPLTPIKLSAQRLRKKYQDKFADDGGVFDECTMTIIKEVDELKTLVNEFSSFARMPASNPSPNDLNEIVGETIALYKTGHRNITFKATLDQRLPVVDVDRDQMKRVLINLIDNAVSAIEDTGEVRVETRYLDELALARLEVIDNGVGIPAEAKQRLFEPYFSTKKTGTGLGLAIVNNIIADHNGYIRVRDNALAGTRFIIEFPIKAITA